MCGKGLMEVEHPSLPHSSSWFQQWEATPQHPDLRIPSSSCHALDGKPLGFFFHLNLPIYKTGPSYLR